MSTFSQTAKCRCQEFAFAIEKFIWVMSTYKRLNPEKCRPVNVETEGLILIYSGFRGLYPRNPPGFCLGPWWGASVTLTPWLSSPHKEFLDPPLHSLACNHSYTQPSFYLRTSMRHVYASWWRQSNNCVTNVFWATLYLGLGNWNCW
jgi:hypothetical protein